MSQENKRLVEKLNEAWTTGENETIFHHYADGIVWTIEGETTLVGLQAVREFMSRSEGHEPPKLTVDKIVAEGDSVICYGEMTMDGAPDCAGIYSFCDVYTFSGGKVNELRSFVVKQRPETEKGGSIKG